MTSFVILYGPLRALLGDRQVYGFWAYDDEVLGAALQAVFALGRGPDGFTLSGGPMGSETGVEPDLAYDDNLALILCETAMLVLGGESSANYRTRELSVSDDRSRQRDLLRQLRQDIFELRSGGGMVFATFQSFGAFLGILEQSGGRFPFLDHARVNFRTPLSDVTF